MNVDNFIKRIRLKRNNLERRLKKCENASIKDTITRKIEMINIMIQEFGREAYDYKKVKRNKF